MASLSKRSLSVGPIRRGLPAAVTLLWYAPARLSPPSDAAGRPALLGSLRLAFVASVAADRHGCNAAVASPNAGADGRSLKTSPSC
jgi:hypothetical protein